MFRRCRQPVWRRGWFWWSLAVVLSPPTILMAAYQPGFLAPVNNLSDLVSAATARTNLGLGTAAVKAASNGSDATVASVTGSYTIGHVATYADTSGSIQDGGAAAIADTYATAATSASITLASTCGLITLIGNTTVATATLPSAVTMGAGCKIGIKDSGENFQTHNVTLKSTAGTIDGVAAATGILFNQQNTMIWAGSDGTNWWIQ